MKNRKMDVIKNVFISHHGKDDEHVQALKQKLLENGYLLRNSSVDSTKPNDATNEAYIKDMLKDSISWAGTFICLIGNETADRDWVNWEIQQAHEMGKKIIGVFAFGSAQDAPIPEGLEMYRDSLVGWNINKIIEVLEGDKYYSELPDGTPRPTSWNIDTQNC